MFFVKVVFYQYQYVKDCQGDFCQLFVLQMFVKDEGVKDDGEEGLCLQYKGGQFGWYIQVDSVEQKGELIEIYGQVIVQQQVQWNSWLGDKQQCWEGDQYKVQFCQYQWWYIV